MTTTNTYDALNRLVQSSTSSGSTARYAYAGYSDAPAAILNTSNAILQQLVTLPGGVSIALQASGNVWSYSNLQGDTTATTNQAGTLTSGPVTYGPWGNLNPGQTAPANLTGPNTAGAYGTNGKLTNTSTSTILLGARTFNPTEAHFLSVDPINGGCANAYVYAHGDPINSSDLSGSDQSCSSFYVTTPSGAIMGSVAANSDVLSFSYVATPPAGIADIGTGLVTVSYPAGSSGSSDITQYLNVQPTTDSFNVALPYIPYPKGSGGKGGSQGVSGTLTITVNYAYYGTATNDGFGIESGGNATITATCQL